MQSSIWNNEEKLDSKQCLLIFASYWSHWKLQQLTCIKNDYRTTCIAHKSSYRGMWFSTPWKSMQCNPIFLSEVGECDIRETGNKDSLWGSTSCSSFRSAKTEREWEGIKLHSCMTLSARREVRQCYSVSRGTNRRISDNDVHHHYQRYARIWLGRDWRMDFGPHCPSP